MSEALLLHRPDDKPKTDGPRKRALYRKRRNAVAMGLWLLFRRRQRLEADPRLWRIMGKDEKSPWLEQAEIACQAYESIQ